MKKLLITAALTVATPLFASALTLNVHANTNATLKASTTVAETKSAGLEVSGQAATQADIFTACSQEAIDVRDNAIGGARALYNNQMAIALDARKEAEKDAIALPDEGAKKEAIKAAVDAYKSAFTQAQSTLLKARKDAWAQFETNVNNCRSISKGEEVAPASEQRTAPALKASLSPQTQGERSLKETILEKLKSLFSK